MQGIPQSVLMRSFFRTYLVGAAYNARGLQNVGFIHAMEPGLCALHRERCALQEARGRYLRHHNCHPFGAPMLVGMFLHTEADIAAGRSNAAAFLGVKDITTNTLSALGDSVFGGSMLVSWALVSCALLVMGQLGAAATLALVLFIGLQLFKLCTFAAGLRYGFSILLWLRRWDLINWGERLKLFNALFLVFFLLLVLAPVHSFWWWFAAICALVASAWAASRVHLPRIVLALGALAAAVFF